MELYISPLQENNDIKLENDLKNLKLVNISLDSKSKIRLINEIEKSNNLLLIEVKSKFVIKVLSGIKKELEPIKPRNIKDNNVRKLYLRIYACTNFNMLIMIYDEIQKILCSQMDYDLDGLQPLIFAIDKHINYDFDKINDETLHTELFKIQNELWWESKRNLVSATIDFVKQGIKFSEVFELLRGIYKTNPTSIKESLITEKESNMLMEQID
jgi:hypothetical protein